MQNLAAHPTPARGRHLHRLMDALRDVWKAIDDMRVQIARLETTALHRAELFDGLSDTVKEMNGKLDAIGALINRAQGGWFVAGKGAQVAWLLVGALVAFAIEHGSKLIGH